MAVTTDSTDQPSSSQSSEDFLKEQSAKFRKDAAKSACYIYQDLTYFDLTHMVSKDATTGAPVDKVINLLSVNDITRYGANAKLHYNLCAYTTEQCNDQNVFAYITSDTLKSPVCLTDDDLYTHATILYNDDGKKIIEYTQDSAVECSSGKNYQFTVQVQCDIGGDKNAAPQFVSYSTSNKCNPEVILKHRSGCPVFSATSFAVFLNNNPWVIAVLMIVFGAVVTFFGRKFF